MHSSAGVTRIGVTDSAYARSLPDYLCFTTDASSLGLPPGDLAGVLRTRDVLVWLACE